MKKGKKLYEGKAKIIFATENKDLVIQHFKDDATAFNNQKKAKIEGKGVLNNRISEYILMNLDQVGIKNHLVKRLNMREQLIKHVEIIPVEFIVRNIATGSLTKRLGIERHFDEIFDIVSADFIPKPSLATYKKIIEKYKIEPQYSIFIEDIARNLKPAYELGMKTVLLERKLPNKNNSDQEEKYKDLWNDNYDADYIIDDIVKFLNNQYS